LSEHGGALRAVALAFAFFTRIPVPVSGTPQPEDWGRSMLAAPLVGLAIGLMLLAPAALLTGTSPGVSAALVLLVWVGVTGALHLDGLADCADAWVGGHGNRARTLEILKDPRCGPVGVTAVVLLLIGKFATLESLLASETLVALVIGPVLGRAATVALMLGLPYARSDGIGQAHSEHLPRNSAYGVLGTCALGACVIGGLRGLAAVAAATLVVLILERSMRGRLGGCTGDGLGAGCELVELTVLVTFALGNP